ncbi:MAG: D-alanine--D-alanine ligase [Thermodesulfobacteriota bacterium]
MDNGADPYGAKMSPLLGKRIAVLMGGESAEREISLRSGEAVLKALIEAGYDALAIDAGRDVFTRLEAEGAEAVFIVLHGGAGEDGSIQGGLEVMGLPYTGSGVMASALCMDKIAAKKLMLLNKIPTPAFSEVVTAEGVKGLKYPIIVKPSAGGSTLGLSLVTDEAGLEGARCKAARFGSAVLAEERVTGREVSISILDGRVFPIVEILTGGGLYDYEAKYTAGGASFTVPAKLPEKLCERLSSIALCSYRALGCSGAARVDILIDEESNPFVLEINTSPGLTSRSLLPMAAGEAGLSYTDLIVEILEGASLESAVDEKQGC